MSEPAILVCVVMVSYLSIGFFHERRIDSAAWRDPMPDDSLGRAARLA
jgi:hypothetical protein